MKNRLTIAIAALLITSVGGVAFAQAPPASPQHTTRSQHSQSAMHNNASNSNMSNQQVEQKIKHELTSHGVTATGVHVAFNDGTATLSGTVYDKKDISKAKKYAKRVQGVKHVSTRNLHARTQKAH